MNVELDRDEWDRVINFLMQAPWHVANPLLMKMTEQLRKQQHNSGHIVSDEPESKAAN